MSFSPGMRWLAVVAVVSVGGASATLAQAPPEVTGVGVTAAAISWSPASGASDYNVYRGSVRQLSQAIPFRCHGDEITTTSFASPANPAPGEAFGFLVTAESAAGEGTPGNASSGSTRALLGGCDKVMRHHVLDRITYGWNEYVRNRLNAVGLQGFINEQLNPNAISEADNVDLNNRMNTLTPAENQLELCYRQVTQAVYARRQLQQIVAEFWGNHFSTDYTQIFDSIGNDGQTAELQQREFESFRPMTFNGSSFRDLLELSALSPAMIYYLDLDQNVAGRPQENYPRELMELHTMGVDGGYTQEDVRQVSLALTGWNVCRKNPSDEDDPLAPCQLFGKRVANFAPGSHDCRAKTLFAGTPQETLIPATCNAQGQPLPSGVNDMYLVLDAVAAHPATPRFVGKKLLQKFITENPTTAQIDEVAQKWTQTGGHLNEVLRVVLSAKNLLNPDFASGKVKTPFEQFAATYRATRADTREYNLLTLYFYLARMQMLPHQKADPTGFSEIGKDWINTNDLLERQNFAWDTTQNYFLFDADIIALLAANGLTAASPPGSIVDFYSDVLFGTALTAAERQRVIDILTTNDAGQPSAVTNEQITKMVAYMIGLPQSLEQ